MLGLRPAIVWTYSCIRLSADTDRHFQRFRFCLGLSQSPSRVAPNAADPRFEPLRVFRFLLGRCLSCSFLQAASISPRLIDAGKATTMSGEIATPKPKVESSSPVKALAKPKKAAVAP